MNEEIENKFPNKVCIYARVSSSENKKNLDTQAQRLENYAIAKGLRNNKHIQVRCLKCYYQAVMHSSILDVMNVVLNVILPYPRLGILFMHDIYLLCYIYTTPKGYSIYRIVKEIGSGVDDNRDLWKTSQRCPECGNMDRRNRKGIKFLCLRCGHADNAYYAGAKNLELLRLAEEYSLRSLSGKLNGGSVNECP